MSIAWITNEIFPSTKVHTANISSKKLLDSIYTARNCACAELHAVKVGGASVKKHAAKCKYAQNDTHVKTPRIKFRKLRLTITDLSREGFTSTQLT